MVSRSTASRSVVSAVAEADQQLRAFDADLDEWACKAI
jgi:hypothetical protein